MQPPDGSHKCKNALRASLCSFFVNENYFKKKHKDKMKIISLQPSFIANIIFTW